MNQVKLIFCFLIGAAVISSCKTGQRITGGAPDRPDTVRIAIDTVRDILTQTPDTVDLEVYRVLKDTVTIIGVGDIMMGTNFPDESYLPHGDGSHLWEPVNSILNDADVTFGNLEGVILNEGGSPKSCSNPDLCYLFRTPERFIFNFPEAGFDVMSLANNHAGDFGDEGRINTMRALDSLGIHHAGLLQKPFTTFLVDGIRYGFAAFSPNVGTVSINDHENARAIVAHLDSITDIVIVSFHGGAEGSKHQNMTREREYYYGENRGNIYKFSHEMIDAGADVVFGHGPHVTRAVEVYKDRFIAYSLGNFLTYARFNLRGENGIAPIVKVYAGPDGAFHKARIIPVIQEGAGGPRPDPLNRAIKTLQRLKNEDFPEIDLTISDDGWIYSGDEKELSQME